MPKGIYKRKPFSQERKEKCRQSAINQFKNGMPQKTKDKIKKSTTLAMARPEVKKKQLDNQPDRSGKNNPFYEKGYTRRGRKHPQFIDGKIQGKDLRYYVWSDVQNKRIRYARYVAEKYLNRSLKITEIVHHINGDCSDDRPENLYVFSTNSEHTRQHGWKNPPVLISNLIK